MLSGETAKGKYPLEAGESSFFVHPLQSHFMRYKADLTVKVMAETAYLAENALAYPSVFDQLRQLTPRPTETAETLAMSAVAASIEQSAGAIIVLSTSGISARFLSKFRPQCPIICGMSLSVSRVL
jgi:pyruvate kinase